MGVLQYYRQPGLSSGASEVAIAKINGCAGGLKIDRLDTEICYYVEWNENSSGISEEEEHRLLWILGTPFEEKKIGKVSFFQEKATNKELQIEIGPRLNFSTAFSTNAVSICHAIGLTQVSRIECGLRYHIHFSDNHAMGDGGIPKSIEDAVVGILHDRMTQCRYLKPIESFRLDVKSEPVYEVDVLRKGRAALEQANADLGLAFDDWDLDYYTKMFTEQIGRNPTSVECFDLAQSNSEHSRHWFFKGRMVVDGKEHESSLFKMVMGTQEHSNPNNVIKFNDNSSAIKGFPVKSLYPTATDQASAFVSSQNHMKHIIFTAETHNFPTGVAPFPGATTGTGGRIRDVQATGRGAHVIAGTAGYSFGNLLLPEYKLPWEDEKVTFPDNFAKASEIAVEASNGASDYGNKFGEPVLAGFARSFGLVLPNGERREWVKPIMFSGGLGSMDHQHVSKDAPQMGMEVAKVGGPVYRIGVGGGAASSIQVQGDNTAELDFGAVQRGDAEMEQKMNRVIRACIEMGSDNPIRSIHDQGAGGNGNVLKEICEPVGALIRAKTFELGDPTISILELWGAEYQESNAILCQKEVHEKMQKIARREKCDVSFVGEITNDGKIRLEDDRENADIKYPVDLELEHVLGSMPRKVFNLQRSKSVGWPLSLPEGLTVADALDRVLRLPSVASKRYLTNKVDRSVTGLVAQQQCVGPLHTPLADVAVTALSHFDTVGAATAIGEQPIKGLLDPACGARMSVGEALTNLVFAPVTDLKDVKCSGNWMWAAKLPGEGAALFDACSAMCEIMGQLGVAIDGGKDSLSMAARVGTETVKAPGTLVVSTYVGCPDITAVVTPDLKCPDGKGILMHVGFGNGSQYRLGGSALAQCYQQIGDVSPDLDDAERFARAFNTTQSLIKGGRIKAGHDISDGGFITCVLEMAFAGNHGIKLSLSPSTDSVMNVLFAEELGIVIEVAESDAANVLEAYKEAEVICAVIGQSAGEGSEAMVEVDLWGTVMLQEKMVVLRDLWEATSVALEKRQANPHCIQEEADGLATRRQPPFHYNFDAESQAVNGAMNAEAGVGAAPGLSMSPGQVAPRMAVIREEGSNGDREMVAAFHMAGFEVWDINMQDLCTGSVTLDRFRGLAFVGGFSYADVCGSAKGWAATIKFHSAVRSQFSAFYSRDDTFSLGVCNGCQLMAMLGWVGPEANSVNEEKLQQGVHLDHNISERYESRFITVRIQKSSSIMLRGMEDSVLGVWVAHGEGRFVFKDELIHENVTKQQLAPLQYVDDNGKPTTVYPLNPNGSVDGIAGLISQDGRHLAMMPHPERCVLPWQWPWMPTDWKAKVKVSPWLTMFKNAYAWCLENQR